MEQRIISLEEKNGYLERQVEQLDEVVRELGSRVDELRREIRAVQGYAERIETRVLEDLPQEKPT